MSIFLLIFYEVLANIHTFHPFIKYSVCLSRHDYYKKQALRALIRSTLENQ
jgi:hypothetical protein